MQDQVFHRIDEFKRRFQQQVTCSNDRLEGAMSFLHCVGAIVVANGFVCVDPSLLAELVQPFTAPAEHNIQDLSDELFSRFGLLDKAQIVEIIKKKSKR
jgi:hypothetical protein